MSLRLKSALLTTFVVALATAACAFVFASLQYSDIRAPRRNAVA